MYPRSPNQGGGGGTIDAIRQYSNVNGSLVATGLACMQTGFMHTCKRSIRWFVYITKYYNRLPACCSAATPNVLEKRMLIWVTSSKNLFTALFIAYLNMLRLTHSSQIIIAAACMYACRACFNLLMEVPYTTVCEW